MRKTLISIDGHIGAGAYDVGRRIARMFDLRYFDRIALPGSSSGNSFATLEGLHERLEIGTSDRVWAWIEKAASYFAIGAAGDDPLLQGAADIHMPLTWDRDGPKAFASEDSQYSLEEVALEGNAVIVHRAGSVALPGQQGLTKVGVFAAWDERVERIMHREGLKRSSEAEKVIAYREEAQKEYFMTVHSADPEDHALYDLIVNTSETDINIAVVNLSRHIKKSEESFAV